MADRTFEVGDWVRVKKQDIIGEILAIHYDTNEVVIRDSESEYDAPDDQLVYRVDDIETFKNRIGG